MSNCLGRIALFTDDPGWHGRQLTQAFADKGYQSTYVSLTECRLQIGDAYPPIKIPQFEDCLPDAVFVRGVPGGSLEEVVFYLDILHALQILNIPVYNNGRAIERSVDKAMTSFLLELNHIPTPRTWVLRDRQEALAIIENELSEGRYIISKPLFGSQGEGVRRLEKLTDLFWLTASHGVFYFQRFLKSQGEGFCDYRVFVINSHAVAAMRRRGRYWLNNVAQGAQCEAIELTDDMAMLAVKSAKALAMDYAGVDIILTEAGNLEVIEVNSIPAWKGLQSICGINIADLLAQDLVNRYLPSGTQLKIA